METIEDIKRELIHISNRASGAIMWENCDTTYPTIRGKQLCSYFADLADRIEEAMKYQFRDLTKTMNAAKMREALENSNGLLEELALIGEWFESAKGQIAENKAALSAPPRNCDKIHDVHEMSIAESPLDMLLVVAPREELLRFIYWLFAEAKGETK